jgi:dihydrofolate reductase
MGSASKVIAGITLSLDGFICDRDREFGQLYSDFEELRDAASFRESIERTGAVVMGRRTFEAGDPDAYDENYEFQVPIFVLTHTPPAQHPKENDRLRFIFVTDGIASAITQAREAAAGKDVQVIGGASTLQQCLSAGLFDELHIDVMPVVFGGGLRLFDNGVLDGVRLERIGLDATTSERSSLRFRVAR